jgi:hypothetical protein
MLETPSTATDEIPWIRGASESITHGPSIR